MKYVMFRRKIGSIHQYIPILFPNELIHADIAAKFPEYGKPVSAGDWSGVLASGKSTTLNLVSNPDRDTHIIDMIDYGSAISWD